MIDKTTDPNWCLVERAAAIDIVVSTIRGSFAGEFQSPCPDFATTISSLFPGSYAARAMLIDSIRQPRTTWADIQPFTIVERSELVVDLDFPADSFLDGIDRANSAVMNASMSQ